MTRYDLDERLQFQIGVALAGPSAGPGMIAEQDATARRLGLSGAEVDLARAGRSFDLRTSSILALVRASRMEDPQALALARRQARRAGVASLALAEVERIAKAFR